MCEMDKDAILFEAMKNWTAGDMVRAYQALINRLASCWIHPKHQVLDNNIPEEFKLAIKRNNMTYERVPPDDHHQNIAERGIQTGKGHMISVLSGVDPNFPMHLWDRLLTGIEMQLNFLRQSNTVPTIPSFAHFWGPYDYNAHPMVPLYCVVEMHAKLSKRKTFGRHSVSGLNVGVSVEHYRCHKIWVKDTKSV